MSFYRGSMYLAIHFSADDDYIPMVNVLCTDGERIYTADYEVRGTLFRAAVVTADEHHIVAPGVDKSSRDCLHVFHARTGARLHRYVEVIFFKCHS